MSLRSVLAELFAQKKSFYVTKEALEVWSIVKTMFWA